MCDRFFAVCAEDFDILRCSSLDITETQHVAKVAQNYLLFLVKPDRYELFLVKPDSRSELSGFTRKSS